LMNAMRQAHADGWFIVFDTLTLADDRLEAFYDNPNALRDYFRDIGRMVLAAEGRKANDSHADCYQYFCVPEYGTANGRLHFHAAMAKAGKGLLEGTLQAGTSAVSDKLLDLVGLGGKSA